MADMVLFCIASLYLASSITPIVSLVMFANKEIQLIHSDTIENNEKRIIELVLIRWDANIFHLLIIIVCKRKTKKTLKHRLLT